MVSRGTNKTFDLAQVARRAGWNVLTFHYRGSWGSGGSFSFAHCADDAATVVAFLRKPDTITRFAIDDKRIAVVGHSMGGIVAARVAANDPTIVGVFLIDPVDLAAVGRSFVDPKQREAFRRDEVHGDLPPLAGTSEDALLDEIASAAPRFDLVAMMPGLAARPIAFMGAKRGLAAMSETAATAARAVQAKYLTLEILLTDHSFSDVRIGLADRLVTWLAQFEFPTTRTGSFSRSDESSTANAYGVGYP